MNERKQLQSEKEIDLKRPGNGSGQDPTQDDLKCPTAADQGFVYYEE